jgi:hypothetical protein
MVDMAIAANLYALIQRADFDGTDTAAGGPHLPA